MKQDNIVTYPAPKGAALSDQYSVTVNGKPLDVYVAPVWEPEPRYEKSFGGPYSFAYFDCSGTAVVQVEVRNQPMTRERLRILPESRGILPEITGSKLSFAVSSPCQLSIEPDGKNGPLLLFANPLEVDPPKPGDAGVIYFGPGLHLANEIKVSDNQTLYIAGGAVVKGGVAARGKNITIRGRGIIDGLDWERFKGPTGNLISLTLCTDVRVEGVILKDSWAWTFPMWGCRNVRIDNVKIVSARCENNDGIGVCNSQHVVIRNCFVRTDDDCITTKGFGWPERDKAKDGDPVEDVTVSQCVLWTDRAHIWRLGCENWAEGMRRLTFRDIDVIHYVDPTNPAIIIQPAEGMVMEDVRFEDIRINGEGQEKLIEIHPAPTIWFRRWETPGNVRRVRFADLVVSGNAPADTGSIVVRGCDREHTVRDVSFNNVVRYGEQATATSPNILIGEQAHGIVFQP